MVEQIDHMPYYEKKRNSYALMGSIALDMWSGKIPMNQFNRLIESQCHEIVKLSREEMVHIEKQNQERSDRKWKSK